jgi:hypothetical protein
LCFCKHCRVDFSCAQVIVELRSARRWGSQYDPALAGGVDEFAEEKRPRNSALFREHVQRVYEGQRQLGGDGNETANVGFSHTKRSTSQIRGLADRTLGKVPATIRADFRAPLARD